jgi:hypothetical protein
MLRGVSRSGAMPEPTVIVRMREDVQTVMSVSCVPAAHRVPTGTKALPIKTGDVSASFCLFAMP